MSIKEKGGWAAIFMALSLVGGFAANLVSAVWKTEDRISTVASAAGERAGAEAARKVVKEEIGPVITAAVMSAVKPIGDRVIEHIAMDDERQKATDKEVLILRSIEARRAARGTR